MKTVKGIITGLALLICPVSFASAASPYVSGSIGLAMPGDSEVSVNGTHVGDYQYNTGYALAGAVGLDGSMYRLEAEIGYQSSSVDKAVVIDGTVLDVDGDVELSVMSYMANGYIDFELPMSPIKPFITAGAGLANAEISGDELDIAEDDTVFAWQIGAGAGFSVAPMVTLDARYRYFAASDLSFSDDTIKIGLNSHSVLLGVRVGF
jgi:opacity protein-like surface antigen